MDRTCHITAAVIFGFFLAMAALLILPRLMGMQPYIVADDGMEPELKEGALAFAKLLDKEEKGAAVKLGDIICYDMEGSGDKMGTKRVQVIDYQSGKLYVKNDKAGNIDQAPILMDTVTGRIRFSIPLLGYFLLFLKTGAGIVTMCLLLAALVFAVFLPELFFVADVEESEDGEEAAKESIMAESPTVGDSTVQ